MKLTNIIISSGFLTIILSGAYLKSVSIEHSNSDSRSNIKEVKNIEEDTLSFNPTSMFPALLVKEKGTSSPLELNELQIDINVVGHIATTTFEMTFYNDSERILEGQLYFPLGENKTASRFAMDVNGEYREGVIVEKEKGRVAFENTTRRTIDPGLLEWTKGNNFKARVYPIPAKGTKNIIFSYEQELISSKDGLTYIMPLGIEQVVRKFELNVEVFKQKIKPETNHNTFENIEFEEWQENFVAKKTYMHFTPNKQLGFSIPHSNQTHSVSEKVEGVNYFFTSFQPKRFSKNKKKATKTLLIWDVSSSGKNRNHKKEITLLDEYLKKNKGTKVELITFSNTIHRKELFTDFNSLKTQLTNLNYDGGTQLGSVDLSKVDADEILLFSDGVSNFGETEIKNGHTPIYTITSSNKSDFSSLKFLSLNSGGVFINLNQSSIKNSLNLLSKTPYRLIGYDVLEGNVNEIYPKTGVISHKNLVIAGQLFSKKAKIRVNLGFGSKIHHSEIIEINATNESLKGSVRRLWAQKKLSHIDLKPKENNELITQHGKKYGLVTRNTSLIVLDRLEDYVQHEITPPKSMQEAYFQRINNRIKNQTDKEAQHILTVKRNWKERIEWLNKEFKFDKLLKKPEIPIQGRQHSLIHDSSVSYNWSRESSGTNRSDIQGSLDASFAVAEDASFNDNIAETMDTYEGTYSYRKSKQHPSKKTSSIKIKEWSPNEPYLGAYQDKNQNNWYSIYLNQKNNYINMPSYFVDISTLFYKKGKHKQALRILSNLAELELENHQILRILGYRLLDIKEYFLAIKVFKEIEKIRGEEPQTYRDLGLAYEQKEDYQKAIESLYNVITKSWDGRFTNIEQIALVEMNNIISRHKSKLNTEFIDQEFIKDFPLDVRVILNWDSDNCDMDLWVTDPRGEKCFYSHNRTKIGGRMSNDFTQGYGPEEFMLKNAISGKYKIQANYYGTRSQKILAPVTLKMQFFTGYGREEQKLKEVTLRLNKQKEVVEIATIEF
tara:strand:+ start:347 stop:3358 length:3012 start_codon:yes stop_codon:yes gene_type:complete